jgi:CheY-like chemotaxis protein
MEAVRPQIEAMGHSLDIHMPSEPIEVEGDVARLAQVFSNLINNAAKYTDPGGKISLTLERDGTDAVIRVRDSGIGLSPDQLTRVFEMFTQVDQSLERGQGGLGVGLPLARTFVELHHGRMEARSDGLGRGSEFIVRLPALTPSSIPSSVPAPAITEERPSPPSSRRVLVADDNADAVMVLAAALEHAGHTVCTAHDGRTALDEAKTFRPDVAILDIGMPHINGYDVARRLREQFGSSLTLIALTGWGHLDDQRRAAEAGFNRHLTKPVEIRELFQLLK